MNWWRIGTNLWRFGVIVILTAIAGQVGVVHAINPEVGTMPAFFLGLGTALAGWVTCAVASGGEGK